MDIGSIIIESLKSPKSRLEYLRGRDPFAYQSSFLKLENITIEYYMINE